MSADAKAVEAGQQSPPTATQRQRMARRRPEPRPGAHTTLPSNGLFESVSNKLWQWSEVLTEQSELFSYHYHNTLDYVADTVNYYVQPAEEGSDAAAAEGGENADNNTQAGPGSSSGDTGKHGAAPGSPAAETSGSGAQASEQVQIEHAAATEVPELIPPPQPATASASSSAPSSALPSASSSSAPAAGQQQGPAAGDGDAANETLETVDLD